MVRTYQSIGVQIPEVFLPAAGVDLNRWAVIACDQFTSQPEYWHQVETLVGSAPSTLNLVFPEVYLEDPQPEKRIEQIQSAMRSYLAQNILQSSEGMIYVERTTHGKTRRGLVLALDLERYDFSKGSQSLIRATEGTIIERLPPRIKIREGAPLELPHILVLIDDPQCTVIEPLASQKTDLQPVYDFELMLGSGHLAGWRVANPALEMQVVQALEALAVPQSFAAKYGLSEGQQVLLFAMGDGNHSLATAKAIWEKIKAQAGDAALAADHPARYALVEIENVHDAALAFEPIHRVLFGVSQDLLAALSSYFGALYSYEPAANAEAMVEAVDHANGQSQAFGVVTPHGCGVARISTPPTNLAVGTLQAFLDAYLKMGGAEKIDYVHGEDVVKTLGAQPGNASFYLPAMSKGDLFKTVILDGALPRKTFSMGEAEEKRFYVEARKII